MLRTTRADMMNPLYDPEKAVTAPVVTSSGI
jgi:hypothetical protein